MADRGLESMPPREDGAPSVASPVPGADPSFTPLAPRAPAR